MLARFAYDDSNQEKRSPPGYRAAVGPLVCCWVLRLTEYRVRGARFDVVRRAVGTTAHLHQAQTVYLHESIKVNKRTALGA